MLVLRGVALERPDWWAHAACTGGDTSPWFPARGQSAEPARRICADCPVVDRCLDYALANPELVGIFAGTTEIQRDTIRSKRT